MINLNREQTRKFEDRIAVLVGMDSERAIRGSVVVEMSGEGLTYGEAGSMAMIRWESIAKVPIADVQAALDEAMKP